MLIVRYKEENIGGNTPPRYKSKSQRKGNEKEKI